MDCNSNYLNSMEPHLATTIKYKLKQWKDSQCSGGTMRPDNEELEDAAQLIVSRHNRTPAPRDSVNLDNLLESFKNRKTTKVEIKTHEVYQAVKTAECANEELEKRMKLEEEDSRGKIQRVAPGIRWLDTGAAGVSVSLLPAIDTVARESVGDADLAIISLLKCPSKCLHLVSTFKLMSQIVKHKSLLLDNMLLAMCLHSRLSTVEALRSCLHTVLSHNYKGVDDVLNSWSPQFDQVLMLIKHMGGSSDSYTENFSESSTSKSFQSSSSHPFINNIKAFLSILTTACQYRNKFATSEIVELITVIAKLALDQSIISAGLCSYLQTALHSLLSCILTTDVDNSQSSTTFSQIELCLCKNLLSLVHHHHNKLHIINMIPSLSERAVDFKGTLAFFAIRQLVSHIDINTELDSTDWWLTSLANECFNLEIRDSSDMYLLHSLIHMFDLAVGSQLLPEERDDLDEMRQELCKQCRALKESPLKPDITKTKTLMQKISLRWDWLVRQATPLDDVLGITYKPTPTKIIPVDSQEVRPLECDEDDEGADAIGRPADQIDVDVSESPELSSDEKPSHRGKSPLKPNKAAAIKCSLDMNGIEKLRLAARQYVRTSRSSTPTHHRNSPGAVAEADMSNGNSSFKTPTTTPTSSPLNVTAQHVISPLTKTSVDVLHSEGLPSKSVPLLAASKILSFTKSEKVELMEIDDLPDLD